MRIYIKNKRLHLEYNILKEYEAGIVLTGDEIKSIRKSVPSITTAYVIIQKGEAFVRDWPLSNTKNPDRFKKLLLHKSEIIRLSSQVSVSIQIKELYDKKGRIKMNICVCQSLNKHDKREKIREKEEKRSMVSEIYS
jgi:SsrA-binding protein